MKRDGKRYITKETLNILSQSQQFKIYELLSKKPNKNNITDNVKDCITETTKTCFCIGADKCKDYNCDLVKKYNNKGK